MPFSNWPVSRRLFAVITLALVMGLVLGGLRVAAAEGSAAQFGQVSALADLGQQVTVLVQDLQNERDATAGPLTSGGTAPLGSLYSDTDAAVAQVRQAAAGIGSGFPANIQADAATVLADISPSKIAQLHQTPESGVSTFADITDYEVPISAMISLNGQISQGVSDPSLVDDVRELNFLSLAKEQVSQQRALLYSLFNDKRYLQSEPSPLDGSELLALDIANTQENIDEAEFQESATPAENTMMYNALVSPKANTAEEIEDFAYGSYTGGPASGPSLPSPLAGIAVLGFTLKQAPQRWYASVSAKVNAMRDVEATIAANIAARAHALQRGASRFALVTGVIVGFILLLVLITALLVARSLVLPLRWLRADALDIATLQLPERVKRLGESPDPTTDLEVAPIAVLTTDEIGQVARAFDQVHAEAVRLAGNEAMLRTSFNAMFVNLSRRSQSLIERLARMIDSLEQNEDDPDRLSSLFSMDHLVTRMRRNSENLLLLAGHEGARKWSEPVALADVARAATSEIEQYSRVVLNIQPGVAVIGQAVSDVVHLLAELIENATLFSPKDTQVQVMAQELNSGGVLIEITDKGIGVSEARLAEMNWRLDNTPTMDVSVSRHMGLFAVARLAARHGVRVRLRPATPQGLTALVWLPGGVVERTGHGYMSPLGLSKPFAGQSLAGRPSPARQSIGTRSAIDSRPAVAGGPGQPDVSLPGSGAQGKPLSNWFRSRRISATGVGTGSAAWTQQRHAAEIIAEPIRGDHTAAGLPMRVPRANLIPGSADGARPGGQGQPLPQRSPELARNRLSGFQRGARRAETQSQQQQRSGEGAES